MSKIIFVNIIGLVATDAALRKRNLRVSGRHMTFQTRDFFMSAIEDKACARIVVEIPQFPIAGIMTIGTLRTEPPLMDIVSFMTRHTLHRRILEGLGLVTFVACNREMCAHERKSR